MPIKHKSRPKVRVSVANEVKPKAERLIAIIKSILIQTKFKNIT